MKEDAAKVSGLYVYPIKSCQSVELDLMDFDYLGPNHDRRWVIVDQKGKFLSQRRFPSLALIRPYLEQNNQLKVEIPGCGDFELANPGRQNTSFINVKIWKDDVQGLRGCKIISQAISDFLNHPVEIVALCKDRPRMRKKEQTFQMGFADSRPLLLLNKASWQYLNDHLQDPIPIDRFRANIIIEGPPPFSENSWRSVEIGKLRLGFGTPCERCMVTTIDQRTGKNLGREPLETLNVLNNISGKICFGQYMLVVNRGSVTLGQDLSIQRTI